MAQQMEQKDRTIQMLNEQIAQRPRPSITTIETRNAATQTDRVCKFYMYIIYNKYQIVFFLSVGRPQLQRYAHSIEKEWQMDVLL